jgi:proline racemase/trans-L-3-hydroxyproline dehydratase
MKISKFAVVVDTHTGGEPTRILIGGGILHIPGETILQKRAWLRENQDFLRTFLMDEPRGHKDMYGAIVTPPIEEDTDFGVIFFDPYRYADMCGHGTMGVVTILIQLGLVNTEPPDHKLILDTPAGKILTKTRIENSEVKHVTFRNVPAFLYSSEEVAIREVGNIAIDIAYGGNYFALVKAQDLNMEVVPEELPKLQRLGVSILEEANKQLEIIDPNTKEKRKIDLVQIYDEEPSPPINVVVGPVKVDRSPCGTGTCAKMAVLNARGMLGIQEEYRYRGILGTEFQGRIIQKIAIEGEHDAIIPEVTGSAYITGFQQLIATKSDPFMWGFKLP